MHVLVRELLDLRARDTRDGNDRWSPPRQWMLKEHLAMRFKVQDSDFFDGYYGGSVSGACLDVCGRSWVRCRYRTTWAGEARIGTPSRFQAFSGLSVYALIPLRL